MIVLGKPWPYELVLSVTVSNDICWIKLKW